jgi:hypothetical protein
MSHQYIQFSRSTLICVVLYTLLLLGVAACKQDPDKQADAMFTKAALFAREAAQAVELEKKSYAL